MQTLGIIGLGAFGKLAARNLCAYFKVSAYDDNPDMLKVATRYNIASSSLRAAAQCQFVVLAVPVHEIEGVAHKIAPALRRRATLLDVSSVKIKPARILRAIIPEYVDILGTHPLFGPQSTLAGLRGHKIVLCPIRCKRVDRVRYFLENALQLKVYVSTPEQHDREMAVVQGLTHLIARVLSNIDDLSTEYSTVSFDHLRKAVDLVRNDSEDLFLAIERDNPHARRTRDLFFAGVDRLRQRLDREEARQPVVANERLFAGVHS